MMNLSVATEHSEVGDPDVINMDEFSALADLGVVGSNIEVGKVVNAAIGVEVGSVGATLGVDNCGIANSDATKKSVDWSVLFSGYTLDFYRPVKKDVRIYVQQPQYIIDLGAKQWENYFDVIVLKVDFAETVVSVVSDFVEGLANGGDVESLIVGVVNGSINVEFVGSDNDVVVVGVYDAIEVVVVVDNVVSVSAKDAGSATFLKEIEMDGTSNKFEVF
ncbi:hypothetical protein V6N11_056381 [Hibiscus sabdariffa]|uniref:Uncharacterized protein n=1 Tax=Hibiscus sabdariffa TaxID=183260 RepID=A0ABR2T3P1_9ROSI